MTASPASHPPQRQRFGTPLQVLVVLAPPPLLERMAGVVAAIEGTALAASFATAAEAAEWLLWKRPAWHLAYVDMSLAGIEELVGELRKSPRPGVVVGVCDHLWREVRERCSAIGVGAIVEKGDLIAFQDDLELRTR